MSSKHSLVHLKLTVGKFEMYTLDHLGNIVPIGRIGFWPDKLWLCLPHLV
jgi:hypothetical protein